MSFFLNVFIIYLLIYSLAREKTLSPSPTTTPSMQTHTYFGNTHESISQMMSQFCFPCLIYVIRACVSVICDDVTHTNNN